MNKRRMANRAESSRRGSEGNGGYCRGHAKSSSSGSYRHTEMRGPGPVEGAGEVETGSPGAASRGVPQINNGGGSQDAASGAPPKGMKTYSEE